MKNRILTLLLIMLSPVLSPISQIAQAQLIVGENTPIEKLVRNYFIGGGAQVSNIRYKGFSRSIGYFDGTKSNIGIPEGVLLTTGWVGFAVGPNTADDAGFAALAPGDVDLANIVNAYTFDACVLEFDFVPYQDTVSFEYVFGSDEYTEYVDSKYNDVFAFFISGPGITGKQNIALVPDTSIPVSINNVNHLRNSQYYVNNYLGQTVEYDGFTTVLKAKSAVTPCETYRLKLAITDVADPVYDSGVFLKSGSFDAGEALSVLGVRDAPEGGCQPGIIEILRGGNLDKPLTVNLQVGGTAINGTDYTAISSTIVFQPGQDTYVIPIFAINDGIGDSGEWVTIFIDDLCKTGLVRDSIRIFEAAPLQLVLTPDTLICEGQSINLAAKVLGGSGVFLHNWDDNAASEDLNISVSPAATRTYRFSVRDSLTGCELTDSVVVRVDILPKIDAGPDTLICPNTDVLIGRIVTGAVTPYTVHWTPETGLSDPYSEIPMAAPLVTTKYKMTLRTEAGCIVEDEVTVSVSDLEFWAGPDTTLCFGDSAAIGNPAKKGRPPYTYQWSPSSGLSDPTSATPTASPDMTTTYHVLMRSSGGCEIEDSVTVFINRIILSAGPDKKICRGSATVIGDTATSPSPPLRYLWTPTISLSDPTSPTPVANPVNPTEYILRVTDARGCVAYDTVIVTVNEVEIDAGDNLAICPGESVELQGSVRRGTNPFIWRWTPSTSLSDTTIRNPIASPSVSTWYKLTVVDGNGCVDRDSVLVTVWPLTQVQIEVEGSAVLCEGDSVILDAGVGFLSYRWSTGANTQKITVRDPGTYIVDVTTTDKCSAGSDTITVSVTDRPAPVITGPLTICAGDSVRFSVTDVPGAIYNWLVFGGFILEGNDTHSIAVRWNDAGTYQVSMTEYFGSAACRGDTVVTVTVLAAPKPSITPAGALSFCEGGSVRLDAPAGFAGYQWSNGDTTQSIIVSLAGTYFVSVRNSIGCQGISPDVLVTVYPLPNPEIIALSPMPVCEGDSVILGLRESYASYEWSTGELSASIVVRSAGTFTVHVRTADGCDGDAAPFAVQFNALPDPVIIADGPLEFCEGDSVRLRTSRSYASYSWSTGSKSESILVRSSGSYTVSVKNVEGCEADAVPLVVTVFPTPPKPVISRPKKDLEATSAESWQWYTEDGGVLSEIPGATSQTYTGLPDVWYRVRIHDANGCTSISEPFLFDVQIIASSTVELPLLLTSPGEMVLLPLTMPHQANLVYSGVSRFEARIRFNESMLLPVGATPVGDVINGERIITVTGAYDSTASVLAELRFVATLGNATETPLVIDYFAWDQPDVLITRIDGMLRMDVCREGGERLFDARGQISLEPNHPNPFNSMTMLTYEIIEKGPTELFVLDMLGRRVATLVDDNREPGRYRLYFDAGALASGVYTAVLRTPTQMRVQRMKLLK
ncbi:MAG: choice-of-anchor L domain-containing protein [Bacteroidota bacterium]